MDMEAWHAAVHGVAKSQTRPSDWTGTGWLVVKNVSANAGDVSVADSIPGLGKCPGGGHGNSFQCFCLENPKDRGAWWATVNRVAKKSDKTKVASRPHACVPWRRVLPASDLPMGSKRADANLLFFSEILWENTVTHLGHYAIKRFERLWRRVCKMKEDFKNTPS